MNLEGTQQPQQDGVEYDEEEDYLPSDEDSFIDDGPEEEEDSHYFQNTSHRK